MAPDHEVTDLELLRRDIVPLEGMRGAVTLVSALVLTSLLSPLPGMSHEVLTGFLAGAMLSIPAAMWVRLRRVRGHPSLVTLWARAVGALGFAVLLAGLVLAVARRIEVSQLLIALLVLLGPVALIAWVRLRWLPLPDGQARGRARP